MRNILPGTTMNRRIHTAVCSYSMAMGKNCLVRCKYAALQYMAMTCILILYEHRIHTGCSCKQ